MHALDLKTLARARKGDHTARDEIFEDNTGLIWVCVRKYSGVLGRDDLFQMGSMGS